MRKKITALTLCIGIFLTGCTSVGDTTSTSSGTGQSSNSSQGASTPTSTPKPTPTPTPEPASGIVLMTVNSQDGQQQVQLFCIDPDTGAKSPLALFVIPSSCDITYMLCLSGIPFAEGRFSGRFSSDFTKIAVTYSLPDTTERHAGWIDTDGNFYDVTTALDLQADSDFAAPPEYEAMGFAPNGDFIYSERDKGLVYYSVPSDSVMPENLTQLGDIDAAAIAMGAPHNINKTFSRAFNENVALSISDQLGENSYLATFDRDSALEGAFPEAAIVAFDAEGNIERSEYLPENIRFTWSGTLSPDGSQIAFLSCPYDKTRDDKPTELFLTSLEGGEPIKVPCELPDSEYQKRTNGIYTMANRKYYEAHYYCAIVGWI